MRGWSAGIDRTSIVGTWRLVTYTDTPEGSTAIQAFGAEPIGYFVFTVDGHAYVNFMRNPPDIAAPSADPDPDACIPVWYCSYFGTYSVDLKNSDYLIHVLGSNVPTFIGTDQKRHFSLHGDELVIAEVYQEGKQLVHTYRKLVREVPRHGGRGLH